jgi:gliding motility-associated-like protein
VRLPLDTDLDGIPDYLDTDSDNDGITDVLESKPDAVDEDEDGRMDNFVNPPDGFGWDLQEGTADPMNTGRRLDPNSNPVPLPDYRNTDSDNDGLLDALEYQLGFEENDCNNDGFPNWRDDYPCMVKFYQGFSPNGDGIDDDFVIDGIEYQARNVFNVYNRWGAIVYTKVNWNGTWDGVCNAGLSANGLPAPNGIYYYSFEFQGASQFQRGYFYLKR